MVARWWQVVLCGLMALGLTALQGSSPAQDAITPGGLHIQMHAGYLTHGENSYCLPVANWGLGRQAAQGYNLEWQLGSNYSIVPVFVKILQRQAIALKGRIEVVTTDPFYPVETDEPRTMAVTREFVAPPGKLTTIALAPRVAPRAAPGNPVVLSVAVFLGTSEKPLQRQELRSTQLEPAHVYSLLLTDPEPIQAPLSSTINKDNRLGIKLPAFMLEGKSEPYPGIKSFNHYLISVDRKLVTSMPLAARDFAFVCVDAKAISKWPAEEQAALVQYAIAGGHLCVINAATTPRIEALGELRTRPLGRGWLIAEAGPLDRARAAMDSWLSGELEELTLWLYGTVGERRLFGELPDGRREFGNLRARRLMLDLQQLFSGSDVSHAASYLHPIWLYRETCRAGAVEPWDYPEFNFPYELTRPATLRRGRNPMMQNWNFAAVVGGAQQLAIRPLYQLTQPARSGQSNRGLQLLALGAALVAVVGAARFPRTQWLIYSFSLAVLVLAGVDWFRLAPPQSRQTHLTLYDANWETTACVKRTLSAITIGETGQARLDTADVIRYLRTDNPGNIQLRTGQVTSSNELPAALSFSAGGPFATAASESLCTDADMPELPVKLWKTEAGSEVCLHVDTSRLPVGGSAVLFTPDGAQIVQAGMSDHQSWMTLPVGLNRPSADRLLQWKHHYQRSRGRSPSLRQGDFFTTWEGAPEPYSILQEALTEPSTLASGDELAQLAWAGLLQPIGSVIPFLGEQCVLFCQLPDSGSASLRFLRLTFDLGTSHE